MKRVKFKDEAERLNVSVEAVVKTYQKLLDEKKIYGIIDATECISFTSEEIESLGNLLSSKPLQVQALTEELRLERDHIHLIIKKLLMENRIKGQFTQDGTTFIPESELKRLVIKISEELGRVDISEISNRLLISKEGISPIIEELTRQVITATTHYTQIRFMDLSHETGLTEDFLIAFVKSLISDKKILGSIDVVNRILIIERIPVTPSKRVMEEVGIPKKEKLAKPKEFSRNQIIVLVIIIFIILGGIWLFIRPQKITQILIRVEYLLEWQGAYGDQDRVISWGGSGTKTVTLNRLSQTGPWIIVANAQKMDTSLYTLRIQIITTDGKVLREASTYTNYGIAQVTVTID